MMIMVALTRILLGSAHCPAQAIFTIPFMPSITVTIGITIVPIVRVQAPVVAFIRF